MKIKFWVALILVLLVIAVLEIWRPGERFRSAWAFADPPLTGDWSGTMTTPTGKRFPVFLSLAWHDPGSRRHRRRGTPRRGYGRFDGDFIVCEPRAARYSVDGAPHDRHGTELAFFTEAIGRHDGVTPGWFNARWDGADELTGRVSFSFRRGASAISGADYPDTQGEGALSLQRARQGKAGFNCPEAVR